MYATPRYPRSIKKQNGIYNHGGGPPWVRSISKSAKTALRACRDIFDQAIHVFKKFFKKLKSGYTRNAPVYLVANVLLSASNVQNTIVTRIANAKKNMLQ